MLSLYLKLNLRDICMFFIISEEVEGHERSLNFVIYRWTIYIRIWCLVSLFAILIL